MRVADGVEMLELSADSMSGPGRIPLYKSVSSAESVGRFRGLAA